jgi:anti-sigma regulatory factor (Ser/Thr protein kinase)
MGYKSDTGRVLILAPTGRDAALASEALSLVGLQPMVCADIETLCAAICTDTDAALIASEALDPKSVGRLSTVLAHQPPWSDFPLVILTSGVLAAMERGKTGGTLEPLGNTTLLERPLSVTTLTHAVLAAVGARRRQYEVRDHLEKHLHLERMLQDEHAKQRVFLREVLASVTGGRLHLCDSDADLPTALPEVSPHISLSITGGLSELRHATKIAALALNFEADRWQDLITSVGEAAMNAAVHGGGGQGCVCADERGTVQVWIVDQGQGIDVQDLPRAALSTGYTTAGSLGHGMKMMLESTDRLWLLTGSAGTTVVIEQDCVSPAPSWYV